VTYDTSAVEVEKWLLVVEAAAVVLVGYQSRRGHTVSRRREQVSESRPVGLSVVEREGAVGGYSH